MTKQELIDRITEAMKIRHDRAVSKTDVSAFLDSLAAVAQVELQQDGEVMLIGIGKLSVKQREARTGRNPRTGESLQIAASRMPAFSASKQLKDVLNS